MMQFHAGARLNFASPKNERLSGTVMKFNRKTVKVLTEGGQSWNISPHLLSLIKNVEAGNIVEIRPQKA